MEKVPFDASTMNMLFDALGATVMAIAATLPPEQKKLLADNLAALAANAERRGDTALETALIDLQRAARL
jgi:dihydroxyacid dehydratase/phosphogluconate dehydratase